MNCAVHTDTAAVAYCRTCGKALCENCKRDVMGAIYCEPCLAARLQSAPAGGSMPAAPPQPGAPSPSAAMLLGFIPGVGAMYNGQFPKAIVHVGIFVMSIVATNLISEYFGIVIAFWVFYMAFDAYKTAEARRLGLPLPDPLGLDKLFGIQEPQAQATAAASPSATPAPWPTSVYVPPPSEGAAQVSSQPSAPVGAIVLIGLGVAFLLSNLGFFSARYFLPLLVIGIGLWIAYKHTAQRPQP
ncbi:MAG TPA: hypothetical protein VF532_24540 [Candidatus Angelobacter sp.]